MRKKIQPVRSGLWLAILTATSCGSPRLSELVDGGGGADGNNIDGATNDAGLLPLGLELLAGDIGGPGNVDGTGAAARFNFPTGVAVDSAGNVYVADQNNSTIRKVTPAGVVTTLAGTGGMIGSADGTGAAARFFFPNGVAVDSAGSVYVADGISQTIRKITAAGVVTTLAGTALMVGSADGTGAAAGFNYPSGVAVDSAGSVYVADSDNHTIRKVTPAGVVTTLAGTAGMAGSADGAGATARFYNPMGVAVDSDGNVYVADQNNRTIRKVTSAGVVTTLASAAGMAGSADDTGAATFSFPTGVAVDSDGNVYVADQGNHTIRKVTAAGVVTTLAGAAGMTGSADGIGSAARFSPPLGIAADSANIYVADRGNGTIRKVTLTGVVTTLAGTVAGTGTAAHFSLPSSVAVDNSGNVYVADTFNHTIRKVTPAGVVTTLAGTEGMAGSADGTGAAARFYFPSGVAVDSASNVYVADRSNDTIRKVTAAGIVSTLAGTAGMAGSADGTGAAARFFFPTDVAVDGAGNVYVAEETNDTIRKITPAGVVTHSPAPVYGGGVAVDSAGNLYVADTNNSIIRKVKRNGTTTTVAGTASMAGILLGPMPRFAFPRSLAIVGDSIVVSDTNALLLLLHGAQ